MDELRTATSPWTGDERRLNERRQALYYYSGEERRGGPARRDAIVLSPPSDPSLALPPTDPFRAGDDWSGDTQLGRGQEHDAIPSVAAIGGHPIHPMLVPLPIGALALTLLSDAAYAATRDRFFARASAGLATVGIATGLMAAGFGAIDFVGRERIRDHRAAWVHAVGNVGAVGLSAAGLALRLRSPSEVPAAAIASSAAVGAMLLVTGWLGGELSYRHRIGVVRDTRGIG
jgi:uncharacterized membrane protein